MEVRHGIPLWDEQKTTGRKSSTQSQKMSNVLWLVSFQSYWWASMPGLQKYFDMAPNGNCNLGFSSSILFDKDVH